MDQVRMELYIELLLSIHLSCSFHDSSERITFYYCLVIYEFIYTIFRHRINVLFILSRADVVVVDDDNDDDSDDDYDDGDDDDGDDDGDDDPNDVDDDDI